MTLFTDSFKEVSPSVISQMVDDEIIRFRKYPDTPKTFRDHSVENGIYDCHTFKTVIGGKLIGYVCVALTGAGTKEDPYEHNFKYYMDPVYVVEKVLLGLKDNETLFK